MINIFTSKPSDIIKFNNRSDTILYSLYQEKENDWENVSQILDEEPYFLSNNFTQLRNNAIKAFLNNSQETNFIYINGEVNSDFRNLIFSFEKENNKFFIDEKNGKILGFNLSKLVIEYLGGFSYLSEVIINSKKDDSSAVSISNEELDWNYLIRYVKLFDILKMLDKESLYDILYLDKILDALETPNFYRKTIKKIPESSYYMFYFNVLSYYRAGITGLDNTIKKFNKKFSRLKDSVLTNKIKAAQESFIRGMLFINPID